MSFLRKLVTSDQPAKRVYNAVRVQVFDPNRGRVLQVRQRGSFPGTVDLRPQDIPIVNQGQEGSCTANGSTGLFGFIIKKLFGVTFQGSRNFVYYNERALHGQTGEDSGAEVSDSVNVLRDQGVCSETEWPYNTGNFTTKPTDKCYTDALQQKLLDPMQIRPNIADMKACLAEGFPFVLGFTVYSSFESSAVSNTGIMPMPKKGEKVLGGHEVMAIGYIDEQGNASFLRQSDAIAYSARKAVSKLSHALRVVTRMRTFAVTPPNNVIICRNSWGTGWGDKGYFYMPIPFISNPDYASDFWTGRKATYQDQAPK